VKQVLELLSVVLNESRESDERWRRWSRQVVDTLLPLLAQGRVRLESRQAQHSLQRVLTSVAPCILRPVDSLLRTLFTEAPQMVSCVVVRMFITCCLSTGYQRRTVSWTTSHSCSPFGWN